MLLSGAILESLGQTLPVSIDLDLGRMSRLLKALGSPQRYIPPVIHVAGTNGKGSVIAFLRQIFEEAGYTVHVYTSPHLVRYNERIRIGGKLICDKELATLLKTCIRINKRRPITLFEIITATAFLAFRHNPADVTLLETGLGGRLDATNLIGKPEVSVVTPISIDHEYYLGRGIKRIANEKAGILKRGQPVVLAKQVPVASQVIENIARKRSCTLWRCGKEWSVIHRSFSSVFESVLNRRMLPIPNMVGLHQRDNAAVAVATLDLLAQFRVSDRAVWSGLTNTSWPARFQLLKSGPLTNIIGVDAKIWIDGGHNEAAGGVLADIIKLNLGGGPVCLVLGMLRTKSPEDFMKPLCSYAEKVYAVTIDEKSGLSAKELAGRIQKLRVDTASAGSLAEALRSASSEGYKNIVVCGSLYLAGQALSENQQEVN